MTAITRRGAMLGASAAVAVASVPTAVVALADRALPDAEAKAKKRAVLIKELRADLVRLEARLDALEERLTLWLADAMKEKAA